MNKKSFITLNPITAKISRFRHYWFSLFYSNHHHTVIIIVSHQEQTLFIPLIQQGLLKTTSTFQKKMSFYFKKISKAQITVKKNKSRLAPIREKQSESAVVSLLSEQRRVACAWFAQRVRKTTERDTRVRSSFLSLPRSGEGFFSGESW